MTKFKWLMVLTATLCSQSMYARTEVLRPMGIDELFRLADEQSSSIKSYRTGVEAGAEAVKAAKAQRLPDVSVSLSMSYLGDGYLWDRDFSDGMSVGMPHFGHNFALEASQVIYSGGAVSGCIELAELGAKMAQLDWEKNRQEVRFLLVGHYLDLCKLHNRRQVLERSLELTEQLIRHMEARHAEGTALHSDITRYELQRETLTLQKEQTEAAARILNRRLTTTLHLPEETVIVPEEVTESEEQPTEEAWQSLAAAHHPGLQQAAVAAQMEEQKLRIERAGLLPTVALVAADHLDGPITIEVPTIDKNFNYWYVGVGVRYNLSSLFKERRKVKQASLQARRAQEERTLAEEEVGDAVQACHTELLTACTELRTQEKSVELADENYRTTRHRYENELALLTDMLDADNVKLSADLGLVNARINVLYHRYKMRYVTGTL